MAQAIDPAARSPHSIEAEENLLSCCLLDGADVVARCLDAGIGSGSFFDSKHGLIFERLVALHRRSAPIDVAIVAEELKSAGQFDAIGGYAFLTQVSGRIATTAQASYFVEKVRDLDARRQIMRAASAAIEGCQSGLPIEDVTATLDHRLGNAASTNALLSTRLAAARLDPDSEPPALDVRFTLAGVPIATPGNLVGIIAQAKAGKSALVGACLAATFSAERNADFLGVLGHNERGLAVLHVDSEQAPADHWRIVDTAKRRAGIRRAPGWLHSYATAGWSAKDRWTALPAMLRIAKRECGGVWAVFIDGVADFIFDPNDGAEVFPFVDNLRGLAVVYDCPIFAVLHQNPGSEKGRGHLGSQIERRAETNLVLEKDNETGRTVVYSTRQRRAPVLKGNGPCFRWDDEAQMHVSVETVRGARDAEEKEGLRELAADVFGEARTMRYTELVAALAKALKRSDDTAGRKLKRMQALGVVTRMPPNLYSLA